MAKDKSFEQKYKEEKVRRWIVRKRRRLENNKEKRLLYGPEKNKKCPYCGGIMTWCSCCEMYSSYCCEEYGTCMCS